MECLSYCIGNSIDLNRLDNHFKGLVDGYVSTKTREVVKLEKTNKHREIIFVFKNGTLVTWNIKRHQIQHCLNMVRPFTDKPVNVRVRDQFVYRFGNKTAIASHPFFDVDCLTMEEDTDELKLSLSFGFSQSVKLQYFETIIDGLIDKYSPIIGHISHTGRMPIKRKQIRQIIGEIMNAKSELNLISNFLYMPKYFWQHPTLEEVYIMLERYLHIPRRVNTINHRLDTLNEIFDMFFSYLESKHSHFLEIIIILLIGIEIVFAVLNIHL